MPRRMTGPTVSILVPTQDRRAFLPQLLRLLLRQDWPHERLEVLVHDDGRDVVRDVVEGWSAPFPVRYLRSDMRLPLGEKRNRLAEAATGDVLVHVDDDDWQPADRVRRAVEALESSGAEVVGKSELCFWDLTTGKLHQTPRIGAKHVTAGSMAYWKAYWKRIPFKPDPHTEERQFLQNFEAKVAQLEGEPWRTVLCIAHGTNMLPKNPAMPVLALRPEDVVPPEDLAFYQGLDLSGW